MDSVRRRDAYTGIKETYSDWLMTLLLQSKNADQFSAHDPLCISLADTEFTGHSLAPDIPQPIRD
jgi:hypothetical protein